MPVEKLFWDDPYLTNASARVTRVSGDLVYLDRSIVFAESGGQESDAGTIGGHEILSASPEGLDIAYRLPPRHGLVSGDVVEVAIDWPRREALMRLHFAAELVLEHVNQRFGRPEKTGAHISQDKARIDFAWEGNISAAFPLLLAEVERIVQADLPIDSGFTDVATQKRYWRIEGFATVPCGGTHPRRTSEVGEIVLRRENPGRGRERIEIRLAESTPDTRV